MPTMFKVVHVDLFGCMTSCTIRRGKLSIDYVPDKWTAKRKYGPMVFATEERATMFLQTNFYPAWGSYEIWECDAENVRECKKVLPVENVIDLSTETIRRRMDLVQEYGNAFGSMWAPYKTFIASRIRLTRKCYR